MSAMVGVARPRLVLLRVLIDRSIDRLVATPSEAGLPSHVGRHYGLDELVGDLNAGASTRRVVQLPLLSANPPYGPSPSRNPVFLSTGGLSPEGQT
jgi:hypothetical protein